MRFVPPVLHNECSSAPPAATTLHNKIPIGISRALNVMSTGRFVLSWLGKDSFIVVVGVVVVVSLFFCNFVLFFLSVAQHWQQKRRYNISIALLLAILRLLFPFPFPFPFRFLCSLPVSSSFPSVCPFFFYYCIDSRRLWTHFHTLSSLEFLIGRN